MPDTSILTDLQDPVLSQNALTILQRRYLVKDASGKVIETPKEMFWRVALAITKGDIAYDPKLDSPDAISNMAQKYYDLMASLDFLPNSPTLMNAGRPLKQLSACFVIPIDDSMDAIFEAVKHAALIHKSGGGTGFSFSRLRPKASMVRSTAGTASGPVSFMTVFNAATETVKQGGTRRGANMGILRVDHPDIREFITCKRDMVSLTNFNISVAITDAFMQALNINGKYDMITPHGNEVVGQEDAQAIFDLIAINAWENGDPGLIFIDEINRHEPTPSIGLVEATNPCVAGETWVTTSEGPMQVAEIEGKRVSLLLDGTFIKTTPRGFFSTGTKEVFRVTTDRGYRIEVTKDHPLLRARWSIAKYTEWITVENLCQGDAIVLSDNRGARWQGMGTTDQGHLQGTSIAVSAALRYGMPLSSHGVERTSSSFHQGFLRGVFSADETVLELHERGVSVKLQKYPLESFRTIQRMLHRLGVASYIKVLESSNETEEPAAPVQHELVIHHSNVTVFAETIGLDDTNKQSTLLGEGYLAHEHFLTTVSRIERMGERPVFDTKVPKLNAFDANGLVVHNCGEQPLLPYESCTLGSINLRNMLNSEYQIDWEHLQETVHIAVRLLDNIIEINGYPLEQIKEATTANRRIGLGVMGFADMLYAIGVPYDSDEALELARKVMGFVNQEGRKASDELAREREPFPNCEVSVHDHPTRNSTVTTIAPTGTISMIADTSSGIEPNFALVYTKEVMDKDRLLYVNSDFERVARQLGFYDEVIEKITAGTELKALPKVPQGIADTYVTAHGVAPKWHVQMQAAFQEHCGNAVSKTVNLPSSATVEDVKNIYLLAWKLKCKGITIYRDGCRSSQVLSTKKAQATIPCSPKPRPRPRITTGYTEQVCTGEGTMYITINEDSFGICEVFVSLGKHGAVAAAQAEAVGRLISMALRVGISPKQIVKQLKGITGPTPTWFEGRLIKSTPDAIAYALERYIKRNEGEEAEQQPVPEVTKELCMHCGTPVVYEEGCRKCPSCGDSSCG